MQEQENIFTRVCSNFPQSISEQLQKFITSFRCHITLNSMIFTKHFSYNLETTDKSAIIAFRHRTQNGDHRS